jgi:hypothetical protein
MTKNLKSVPAENTGLNKLPENVRNRMGYLKKGSKISKAKVKPKRVVKKRKTTKRKK